MPKLNQIIAIEESAKKRDFADLSKSHHVLQKADLFTGFIRTFKTRDEEGAKYQDEIKTIQQDAKAIVKQVQVQLSELFNITAAKDIGNCNATADIVVDGAIVATGVPVTYLLFLEKRLVEIRTFVQKLPVLDPAREWSYDGNRGVYVTKPKEQVKTRKVHKSLVKIEPTKEHPGQAEIITVDEVEGYWYQTDISSAYTADAVREILERVTKLESAVKFAREQANSIDVQKQTTGEAVLNYIFGAK